MSRNVRIASLVGCIAIVGVGCVAPKTIITSERLKPDPAKVSALGISLDDLEPPRRLKYHEIAYPGVLAETVLRASSSSAASSKKVGAYSSARLWTA